MATPTPTPTARATLSTITEYAYATLQPRQGGTARIGSFSGYTPSVRPAFSTAVLVNPSGEPNKKYLLYYFTKPYIAAHELSRPSWRYSIILQIIIVLVIIVWSAYYQFSYAGGGFLGALCRKFLVRKFSIGGKERKTLKDDKSTKSRMRSSPTYGQLLTLLLFLGLMTILCVVGPSYINPRECLFGGKCEFKATRPPGGVYKRQALGVSDANPYGWVAAADPLLSGVNTSLGLLWWTASGRIGIMIYAMFPLIVSLGLKLWPFNIFAAPFTLRYHFDKTAFFHRWFGRIAWALSTIHMFAWGKVILHHKDPLRRPVLTGLWYYFRFIGGCVAYGTLTILVVLSLKPIRSRFYEIFYWSHVVLVILTMVGCLLHSFALMWWPITALGIWGVERGVRLILFFWINGIPQSLGIPPKVSSSLYTIDVVQEYKGASSYPPTTERKTSPPGGRKRNFYFFGPGKRADPSANGPVAAQQSMVDYTTLFSAAYPYAPMSPGIATLQVLSGRTLRIVLRATSNTPRWFPGQHVYITIPSVRPIQGHPFTICNVDERHPGIQYGQQEKYAPIMVLIVRAQRGFTRALYDKVLSERSKKEQAGQSREEISKGVMMPVLTGEPMGSAARVRWDDFDSVLIVSGGAGVAFGLSIFEYCCRRMALQHAVDRDQYKTNKIRFVWIVRNFVHLSWVASSLRRCLEVCSSDHVQVDIFVSTRGQIRPKFSFPMAPEGIAVSESYTNQSSDHLVPPQPSFYKSNGPKSLTVSTNSVDTDMHVSDSEYESDGTLPQSRQREKTKKDEFLLLTNESVSDLAVFDGEEDVDTAVDVAMSRQLKQEGKIRRAKSRKNARFGTANNTPSKQETRLPSRNVSPSPSIPSINYEASLTNSMANLMEESRESVEALQGSMLDMTASESEDLSMMAELAGAGRPRLSSILDEEVSKCTGKMMVACCGPTELSSTMRKLVCDRIDLGKVWRKEPGGEIAIICEEFAY